MARSAVTVAKVLKYNTLYEITRDAIDLSNDHEISLSGCPDGKLAIVIAETGNVADIAVTVKAGKYSAGAKDLSLTVTKNKTYGVTFESSKYKDSDGNILIDLASTGAATGEILAVCLPS
jgi:hypothetical protein